MKALLKKRPPEFPERAYKLWSASRSAPYCRNFSFSGSLDEVRKQTRVSLWDEVKPLIQELNKLATSLNIGGLTFNVHTSSDYGDDWSIEVKALGFKPKTERERLAGQVARERTRQRKEAEARSLIETEQKQLKALLKKYPDAAVAPSVGRKNVPLFHADPKVPGQVIRVLNGKKTTGVFNADGTFKVLKGQS